MTQTLIPDRPLRRAEAAAYIEERHNYPCKPSSLRTQAVNGTGPVFRKSGRFPVYDAADLDDWVRAKTSRKVKSTSELTALRATSAAPVTAPAGA
jgi:hypothetical protein